MPDGPPGLTAARDASVLVLPTHLRPGPWVIRSLVRAGFRVVGGSDRTFVGATLAGERAARVRVPAPSDGVQRFIERVRRIVRREGIDVILPLSESTVAALIRHGDDELQARLAGPTPDQYAALADKARLQSLAHELRIPTLAGAVIDGWAHDVALPDPPVVVKPLVSASSSEGAVVYLRPVLARTAAERDRAIDRVARTTGRALVQPFAHGPRLHVHAWRSAGASGGLVTRVLRSWPPDIGMTSASSVIDEPRAIDAVVGMLDAVGYRGVASADMIGRDGEGPALHDVNPRLPFSVAEAVAGGLDTPRIAVEIALGMEPTPSPPPVAGRGYHWVSGEIRWLGQPGGGAVAREVADALVRGEGTVDPLAGGVAVPGVLDLAGTGIGRLARSRVFGPLRALRRP